MNVHCKIFFSGSLISFLGALPLGTLNITAFQLSAGSQKTDALLFALAALAVELVIVRLTLFGVGHFQLNNRFFSYFLLIAVAVLVYLSITNFLQLNENARFDSTPSAGIFSISPLLLGLTLSAVNPLQIPFWIGWNEMLVKRNMLSKTRAIYSLYLAGIGIGTLLVFIIFITAGQLLSSNYQQFARAVSIIMASLYLLFAGYLIYRFIKNYLKTYTI